MKARILLALGAALLLWPSGLSAQDDLKVQTRLIAERAIVQPGGTVTVALRETIAPRWHTYWINPGDSGEPTRIRWTLPEGWTAGDIQWPYPARIAVGPLMNFGYSDEVLLFVDVTAPADAKPGDAVTLAAHATWLVCEEICIPEEADLTLDLEVAALPGYPENAGYFAPWRERLPRPSPWPAKFAATETGFALFVESPELAKAAPRAVTFFPYTDGYIKNAAEQDVQVLADGLRLATAAGWRLATPEKRAGAKAISGLLVVEDREGATRALDIALAPGAVPGAALAALDIGWLEALLFAFLGGLVLNLMPCVLPVLSMKALAFARKRGAERGEAAKLALLYGAGVLVSFVALAAALLILRAGGEAVGWGFQLQEPSVVAFFALLMFAVGLNLSGVFEVTPGFAGAGSSLAASGGTWGSFFTGVLAVAVATPCTAPFMGAAMGFALVQPAPVALAVFLALGVGFALPFVLLGLSPAARRWLPRPGPWMELFKQALAFPMYAAAIWLVWVLSQQAGPDGVLVALAAALLLGFAAWLYGRRQRGGGRFGLVAAALALAGTLALIPYANTGDRGQAPDVGGIPYEAYSPARLAELRAAGRPVFVNATAAWCITCLVNEKVALSTTAVADAFAANDVVYLKADWTNRDADIAALLESFGRSGVPLYLYYAAHADNAVVLPQVLTEGIVIATISGKS